MGLLLFTENYLMKEIICLYTWRKVVLVCLGALHVTYKSSHAAEKIASCSKHNGEI